MDPLGYMAATTTPCERFSSVLVTHKYIFRQRSACLAPCLVWLTSLIQRYYEEFDQSRHMILTDSLLRTNWRLFVYFCPLMVVY